LEDDSDSWLRLGDWLTALNDSNIPYTITLSANRADLVGPTPDILGTTTIIEQVYQSHMTALSQVATELENITDGPQHVIFDFTLSQPEWQQLMLRTRSLDLIGFAGLMRSSIYSINIQTTEQLASALLQQITDVGLSSGIIIESFAIDDLQDTDNIAMRLCGVSLSSLNDWDIVQVSCSRSRFSLEMNGDVGEYLVESYSKSIGSLGSPYSIRIGEVGNITDIDGRSEFVYETLDILADDIILATGNGVGNLTIDSLPSLITSFGSSALTDLRTILNTNEIASATYTFRIYAYRAVFIAIDSFDFIML
jgi:hypothetical protein